MSRGASAVGAGNSQHEDALTANFHGLHPDGQLQHVVLAVVDGQTHASSVLWQTWGPAEDRMAHVVEAVRLGAQP